ncbi:hypothetical protein DH2020_008959 [Rehmannia glutinosa]|uniref:Uncharacterized protein n=1 Tax=Rehmannia glutinosa TaxID=99300 RepID=A0ABR0X7G2_REHGL
MPTKKDVAEKLAAINKINSFVYTAAAVKRMLDEKRAAGWGPPNVAAEKAHLKSELVMARDDVAERERIEADRWKSEEASSLRRAGKDEKGFRLAELNRKNKIENLKNGSKVSTSFENGGGGYDPFSRRWTKSRNYYAMSSVGEINGGIDRVLAKKSGDVSSVGGAGGLVDTSAPLDQGKESNKMHDFELSISLAALEKFGGAKGAREGFMANKQRIEATQGCKAPVDVRKHGRRILTVDEYRKRRGLI